MKKPLVIILAGGIGSHFVPLTVNKTLIPFMGKPLLQHTIETVEQNGFSEALIITNRENEQWLSTYQPFNITLQTHLQEDANGMADAILSIESEIDDRPILIMNAVDLIDPVFFKSLYRATLETPACITGFKTQVHQNAGYIRMEGSKAIEIVEKPVEGAEPSDLINLVFHYFSDPRPFIDELKKLPESDDRYEKGLSGYMKSHTVSVLEYSGYWQKLKYSHHVLDMTHVMLHHRLKSHQARSAYISPHAVIEGTVYIDEDAHIDSFAVIKGPAYIGRGAKIGNHALVRQSIIEEGSIVGFGSEVARSYIGPRCALHKNFIGDSVLESDINPSWGTTTGNLRLDGKPIALKLPDEKIQTEKAKLGAIIARGAFLGINCSLMPGVTIGKYAQIFPAKTVNDAIKEHEVVK